MKAAVCRAWGSPSALVVEDIAPPVLLPNCVRIRVRTSGVGFQDLLMIAGQYETKPDFPFVPGNEVAGEVVECGAGVAALATGDRVLAIVEYGGYAEQVVTPEAAAVKLPSGLSFTTAAALGMAYGTAFNALVDRARLQSGEVLLVRGAGSGVGLAAVDLGRSLGATIIAAASSDEKLAAAAEAGAHFLVNTAIEDLRTRVLDITGGKGADVIFDPVGSDFKQACLRCIARNGRILMVGFAGGEIPSIPAHYLIIKYCSIMGVNWGPLYGARERKRFREVLEQLLKFSNSSRINPRVGKMFRLEDAASALTALLARKIVGRSVLVCE